MNINTPDINAQQAIATIVWDGDFPAAQQLAHYLSESVKSGAIKRDFNSNYTDASGGTMTLHHKRSPDLQEAKFWLGSKIILRNYHPHGNARNVTKDVLIIAARMLEPVYRERDASEKEAYCKASREAERAYLKAQKATVISALPKLGEQASLVDFAQEQLKRGGHSRIITNAQEAASTLSILFPYQFDDCYNLPTGKSLSELAGYTITIDRKTGVMTAEGV
jgi:hypothetical protein